jgi:hypothetical protein
MSLIERGLPCQPAVHKILTTKRGVQDRSPLNLSSGFRVQSRQSAKLFSSRL